MKNLSRPGALTVDALVMADGIEPGDHLVLIEIGGNDLLGDVAPGEFAKSLEALLAKVTAPGRSTVMFELPLLPHKIEFGRIQRLLAARYRVPLIPKRYFTEVIRGADATTDGLHLSSVGARRMADLVTKVLSPVLKPHTDSAWEIPPSRWSMLPTLCLTIISRTTPPPDA